MWPELEWVGRLIGSRFRHHHFGLGSRRGTSTPHVPHVGNLPVTTRASLSPDVALARATELKRETGRHAEVWTVTVESRHFDDLGIRPLGAKVDVEGLEYDVLLGMETTLRVHQPILMLEYSDQTDSCREMLASLRYRFWDVDRNTGGLRPAGNPHLRNWFAVPHSSSWTESVGSLG